MPRPGYTAARDKESFPVRELSAGCFVGEENYLYARNRPDWKSCIHTQYPLGKIPEQLTLPHVHKSILSAVRITLRDKCGISEGDPSNTEISIETHAITTLVRTDREYMACCSPAVLQPDYDTL